MRHDGVKEVTDYDNFNPRTSCEVRPFSYSGRAYIMLFQSTHLVWGATLASSGVKPFKSISIHAPRVRCDNFVTNDQSAFFEFQSTHLVWGATGVVIWVVGFILISIHAPRVRCDKFIQGHFWLFAISIHAPRVRCDISYADLLRYAAISIHAPRVRCDITKLSTRV